MGKADVEAAQAMLGIVHTPPGSAVGDGVVLVCIDCEAYELAQHKITEIGISVLDTRAVRDLSPTDSADKWFSKIASHHFRINEFADLVNKKYVKGNPEAFAFGTSTFIDKEDAKSVLRRVFEDPVTANSDDAVSRRNVVVVGHSLKNDVKYMHHLGFSLNDIPNIVRRLDTQSLVGSKKTDLSLSRLLRVLEIEVDPEHLHNAGNDAAFTLQAFVLTALKEHAAPGSVSSTIQRLRAEAAATRTARKDGTRASSAFTESATTDQDRHADAVRSTGDGLFAPGTHPTDQAHKPIHRQVRSMEDYETSINKMSRRQRKLMRRAERRAAKLADDQKTLGANTPQV
ncbi:hypothetical protein DOTSEDRAFT_68847 [Dothistroma septosporum NZE10]|uniref:Gfd2/YDR514C-like C-terminal domain-containing protein n=1 Tax=Dothistroma septosporum (strain NZE10 / CBS 128990) TaxID=675120 RepID=N1Q365_DOTSN|nr:hypothetical protein DOTSEDRAFT_68847 [Dothistroma septosporum NZE10]